jgi:hypothetical protein
VSSCAVFSEIAELDLPEFSGILQTEQSNTDDFGIRLRFNEEKTEISKCNPNVVRAID